MKDRSFKIDGVDAKLAIKIEALRGEILTLPLIGAVGLQTTVIIGALITLARLLN